MAIIAALKSLLPISQQNLNIEMSKSDGIQKTDACVIKETQNHFQCKWNNLPLKCNKYELLSNNSDYLPTLL